MTTNTFFCIVSPAPTWRRYTSFTLASCVAEVEGEWVERTLHVSPSGECFAGLVEVEGALESRFPKQIQVHSAKAALALPPRLVERVVRRMLRNRERPSGGDETISDVRATLSTLRVRGNFFEVEEEEEDGGVDVIFGAKQKSKKPRTTKTTMTALRNAVTFSERTLLAAALGPWSITAHVRRCALAADDEHDPRSLGEQLDAALEACPELAWFGDGRLARLECTSAAFPESQSKATLLSVARAYAQGDSFASIPLGVSGASVHAAAPPWPPLSIEESGGSMIVQLKHIHDAEKRIGALLARLSSTSTVAATSDARVFAFAGKAATRATDAMRSWAENPRSLHPEQEAAVNTLMSRGACVLEGAAGSGKTTIVAEFVRRLTRGDGAGSSSVARTLHSVVATTLPPRKLFPSGRATLILDEASMLNVMLLDQFVSTIEAAGIVIVRLVLVGDLKQLPPVNGSSVQHEAVQSQVVPVCRLDTSQHRQQSGGEGSGILRTASRIIGWDGFFESQFASDVFEPDAHAADAMEIAPSSTDDDVRVHHVAVTCAPRYRPMPEELESCVDAALAHARALYPEETVQVIASTNAVCDRLNGPLRDLYNPPGPPQTHAIRGGGWQHRVGDRVMALKNVYLRDDSSVALAIGNGDLGDVVRVTNTEATVRFFNGEEFVYGPFRTSHKRNRVYEELTPAYAVTVHKFQGSECKNVIYANFSWKLEFLSRNLLYTAITRAKRRVLVVSSLPQLCACAQWTTTNRCRLAHFIGQSTSKKGSSVGEEGLFSE